MLIAAETNPDPDLASNWRASAAIGGSPGEGDGVTFTGDPAADGDGDGLSALAEHALGSSDADASSGAGATSTGSVAIAGSSYATFSYRYDPAAGDVLLSVETATDLSGWEDAGPGMVEVESVANADGTVTRTMRQTAPISGDSTRYFRLRIELR